MPTELKIEITALKTVHSIKEKLRNSYTSDFEYKMILSKINMLLSEEIYGLIKTDYNEFLQIVCSLSIQYWSKKLQ